MISKYTVSDTRTLIKIKAENKLSLLREFYRYINFGNSVCIKSGSEIKEDTGLNYLNIVENEGYFVANTELFIQTLINLHLFKLSSKTQCEKDVSDKMQRKAEILGINDWNNIPDENFLKIEMEIPELEF